MGSTRGRPTVMTGVRGRSGTVDASNQLFCLLLGSSPREGGRASSSARRPASAASVDEYPVFTVAQTLFIRRKRTMTCITLRMKESLSRKL